MTTFTKVLLSGSTGGKQIKVAATATPGDLIHTTGTSATALDRITLYATNQDATAITLTIEWGGTTDPDDRISVSIPSKSSLTLVTPPLLLSGDGAAGRTVRAFAATANKIMVSGEVDRIA